MNRLMNSAAAAALATFAIVPWAEQAAAAESDTYCWNGGVGAAKFAPCTDLLPLAVTQGGPAQGQTEFAAGATGTTSAVTLTIAAVAAKTNYLCGFNVSAIGGTAAVGPITLTGLAGIGGGATLTYELAASASGNTLGQTYTPCLPASGTSIAVVITTTADGTASAVAVNAWGFQQ